MPNGHGTLLGCHTCKQLVYNTDTHTGICKMHDIPVEHNTICHDLEFLEPYRFDLKLFYTMWLERNTLYIYVSILEEGYPPPLEQIPLARIEIIKNWGYEERKLAFERAKELATKKYHDKQIKQGFFETIIEKVKKFISG